MARLTMPFVKNVCRREERPRWLIALATANDVVTLAEAWLAWREGPPKPSL
jgi:hypothetical protein